MVLFLFLWESIDEWLKPKSVIVSVSSSEKVDKQNRYSEFLLSSIPYPGCEFFRDWKDNGYRSEGLVFDWNQVS